MIRLKSLKRISSRPNQRSAIEQQVNWDTLHVLSEASLLLKRLPLLVAKVCHEGPSATYMPARQEPSVGLITEQTGGYGVTVPKLPGKPQLMTETIRHFPAFPLIAIPLRLEM